jgi:hypothetical protein
MVSGEPSVVMMRMFAKLTHLRINLERFKVRERETSFQECVRLVVSLVRSFAKPLDGLVRVFVDTFPVPIATPQVKLRLGKPLVCSLPVPRKGLGVFLGYTSAIPIAHAQV